VQVLDLLHQHRRDTAVVRRELGRDLRHRPAVVAAAEYRAGARSGIDIGDHLLWDDYSRNYTSLLADDLFGRADVGRGDVEAGAVPALNTHGTGPRTAPTPTPRR